MSTTNSYEEIIRQIITIASAEYYQALNEELQSGRILAEFEREMEEEMNKKSWLEKIVYFFFGK